MLRSNQSALLRRKGARDRAVGWSPAILGGVGPRLGMESEIWPKQVEEGPCSVGRSEAALESFRQL